MDGRSPGPEDDPGGMPLDDLRRVVYAPGVDEGDPRWTRAAAELGRRERASLAAAGDGADGTGDPGGAEDPPEDAGAPRDPSRRPLAWAAGALVVGLLGGAGIAAGIAAGRDGAAAPSAEATASPTPTDPADADAPEPPDPADVLSLLGTDIGGRSRGIALQDVLDRPREEADSPPRSPRGDVDLSSIRGVQTSVGLYVARTISADVCLLVYPWSGSPLEDDASPGSGILSCVSPAQLAASDLHVTWVADAPLRAFDGRIVMAGIELTAALAPDGTITLAFPAGQLAY
ncbi:hypothetical protein [Clavibacter michiganensis]|nr:hypothetical protein [Clavibacter michiganensis]